LPSSPFSDSKFRDDDEYEAYTEYPYIDYDLDDLDHEKYATRDSSSERLPTELIEDDGNGDVDGDLSMIDNNSVNVCP
jgi:hypothetical protein